MLGGGVILPSFSAILGLLDNYKCMRQDLASDAFQKEIQVNRGRRKTTGFNLGCEGKTNERNVGVKLIKKKMEKWA